MLWRVFASPVSLSYLLRMSCGRSCLCCESCLLELCFFPALYSMLVNVLFASCMSVGGCSAAKASSVSCVNLSSLPSCSWYMIVCSVVLCVCCQSVLLVVLVGGLSLVHDCLPGRPVVE